MTDPQSVSGDVPVVAMVGGGASATLTAVRLLRGQGVGAGRVAPRVVLIDRHGRHGRGRAYATADPDHLLNATAARMSAFEDDPGHLVRWATGQGWSVTGADYLPRALYGRYLRTLLDEASRGWPPGWTTEITGTVTSLSPVPSPAPSPALVPSQAPGPSPAASGSPWRLHLADGRTVTADAVVVATGSPEGAALSQVPCSPRCVTDPWEPGALDQITDGSAVLVVGTGLTMADVAMTVGRRSPRSVIYAISRHGLLPRSQPCRPPRPAEVPVPAGDLTLARLMRLVRENVRARGGEWHGVVDALRPHIPELWGRLSLRDKRRFLTMVARHWEVHRHRMPPATADRIDRFRSQGRLRVLSGQVLSAHADGDAMVVRIHLAEGRTVEIRAGWLVNATGPAGDPRRDPFIGALFDAGLARPDPLGLGLDADPSGALLDALGTPHRTLFTLGPTLRGLRYETTAIPEIRTQAGALAARLSGLMATARTVPGATPLNDSYLLS